MSLKLMRQPIFGVNGTAIARGVDCLRSKAGFSIPEKKNSFCKICNGVGRRLSAFRDAKQ